MHTDPKNERPPRWHGTDAATQQLESPIMPSNIRVVQWVSRRCDLTGRRAAVVAELAKLGGDHE